MFTDITDGSPNPRIIPALMASGVALSVYRPRGKMMLFKRHYELTRLLRRSALRLLYWGDKRIDLILDYTDFGVAWKTAILIHGGL